MSFANKLRDYLKAVFLYTPGKLRRISQQEQRCTLAGLLSHAKSLGFQPNTVIDVGVARGTDDLYDTFPEATHLLVEPIAEFEPYLHNLMQTSYPHSNYHIIIAAASSENATITFNVHPGLVTSSIYKLHNLDDSRNGETRTVPTTRLDFICNEKQLTGPYLVKIDVQGAELNVLDGMTDIFDETEYIVLEVSNFQHFEGAPTIADIITYMTNLGYAFYDCTNPRYRPLDGAMYQFDIAFVKQDGLFRTSHMYGTSEQRYALDKRIRENVLKSLEKD